MSGGEEIKSSGPVVMDTNVAVVANGDAEHASLECVNECIDTLLEIRAQAYVCIDSAGFILEEYRRHLSPSGEPGPGDAFFKWLWDNRANTDHCRLYDVTEDAERGFSEFPDDPELVGFHQDDRKFVAVALAAGDAAPRIINAVDRDWWEYRHILARHRVAVTFLCPELMEGRASR
jgi:hypothetical protein